VFCADLTAKYAKFYAKERKVVMLILPQIHRFYVIFREFFTQSFTEFFLNWIVLRELHRDRSLGRFTCWGFKVSSFRWMDWNAKGFAHQRGVALDRITNDAI